LNKRVLITGGAGFIGSNLAKLLIEDFESKVTVIDDLFTGTLENLKGLDVEFVKGSVLDRELLSKHVRNKDIILHLAARNIIVSNSNPREDLEVNIIGTFNVLETALKNSIEKVVYTSTSSIYGNPRYLPINEDEPPKFLNFYSVSKSSGESYSKTFFEVHDLPVSIVRYSNVYGYNQSPSNPYCGVIGKFINNALKDEPIKIHGDGEQTRDFTFVIDACNATIKAALNPKAVGEVYNIGTGIEVSVNILAEQIIKITNSKSTIEHIDKRDIDNIRRRVLNIEKIRHDLKFFPLFTLKDGLKRTIDWFNNI